MLTEGRLHDLYLAYVFIEAASMSSLKKKNEVYNDNFSF